MVGWRRDQLDAGLGVPECCDLVGDLVPRQLAALPGLRTLGHLDLQLLSRGEIAGGDAKPAGGDLLDRRVPERAVASGILPSLSGVRQPSEVVHRLGERFVRFLGQGAKRHRCRGEPARNSVHRLDLHQLHRRADGVDLQQIAQLHRRSRRLNEGQVRLVL